MSPGSFQIDSITPARIDISQSDQKYLIDFPDVKQMKRLKKK